MSVKYMILGCLLDAPAHGYEIRQRFKRFYNQAHGLNEGQLYTTLRKLEEEGLVTKELMHQEKSPPRKILRPTEKGRREFYDWVRSGEDPDRVLFDFFHAFSFLQKCNYFMHISPEDALALIDSQMERESKKAGELKRARDDMISRNVNWHRVRIIEFGISFQETKIKWLAGLAGEIRARS